MGRLEEALDDLEEAVRISPQSHSFYFSRGIVYSKMDLHDKAVENYTRVITLTKDKPDR